jgi:hypothetical protein
MSTVKEVFHLHLPVEKTNKPGFLCGCEFEIEAIKAHPNPHPHIQVDIDHSLRNNGHEYKTAPNDYKSTLELFDYLHKNIQLGKEPFSHRTSTHVHVNVSTLNVATVRQMVLAYALLEPMFFAYVGKTREHNIFCVPLYFTTMPEYYKKDLLYMHNVWHKYTAFNILPLGPQKDGTPGIGTLEFRHLYGTNDKSIFTKWLTILKEFYEFFEKNPDYNIVEEVAKGKTPASICNQIIPSLCEMYPIKEINSLCADTMLDVKLTVGSLAK